MALLYLETGRTRARRASQNSGSRGRVTGHFCTILKLRVTYPADTDGWGANKFDACHGKRLDYFSQLRLISRDAPFPEADLALIYTESRPEIALRPA